MPSMSQSAPQQEAGSLPAQPQLLQELAGLPALQLMQKLPTLQPALDAVQLVDLYTAWLLRADPREAYVGHFNLATACQQLGRQAMAEQHYRLALAQRELPEARFNLGLCLEAQGRLFEALWALQPLDEEKAQSDNASPLRLMALNALSRVARRLGLETLMKKTIKQSLALKSDQPELKQLQASGAAPSAANDQTPLNENGDKQPVIRVVAVCFNEAAILPFFLDHYVHFVGASKIYLHDGGSTDETPEIAARYPQVELIVKKTEKIDDRELMHIRNEEWKKHREGCDWMVVCDVDEFLYHPRLRERLAAFKREGVTLPMVEGFEMLSKRQPVHRPGHYLWEEVQAGMANPSAYNKNLIFDPVIDINYTLGCHHCQPTGPVKRSELSEFKNLHNRMLSYEHIIAKARRADARLSDWNRQTHAGFHHARDAAQSRIDYHARFLSAVNVVEPRIRPMQRRDAFEHVLRHLQMADDWAHVAELGSARGFGAHTDSGSTEFLAWAVHDIAGLGSFSAINTDARAGRHAQRELQARGLVNARTAFVTALPADAAPVDVLWVNAVDYYGDEAELFEMQRTALNEFTALEPRLASRHLVVLDGIQDEQTFEGRHKLLAAYLIGRGYQQKLAGYATVFASKE